VQDERVLAAIASVPRSAFVPAQGAGLADVDTPIPIPHDQVTTQPSLVARMVEALGLKGVERGLEVGTGYGWQTALLAEVAHEVFSVERLRIDHDGDEILTAHVLNAAAHVDPAGHWKVRKIKQSHKIDALVASVIAYSCAARAPAERRVAFAWV
jgi:protein-L-isoaspartate O-methyltransferase